MRYGYAQGERYSEARVKQTKRLQATNWSVFRKQLQGKYKNDKALWRAWLLDLEQGRNIYQAALVDILLGEYGHFTHFPKPPGFPEGDFSWTNDEELVNWSHQEQARLMRAALPPGFFTRERQQYAALRNGYCDRGAVQYFIKVPIWVGANGKAHFTVLLDGQLHSYGGGITISADLAGTKVYLDYDPSKSKNSLVSLFFFTIIFYCQIRLTRIIGPQER